MQINRRVIGRRRTSHLEAAIDAFWASEPEPQLAARREVIDPVNSAFGEVALNRVLDDAFARHDGDSIVMRGVSRLFGGLRRRA